MLGSSKIVGGEDVIDPIGTHNEASVRRQSSGTRAILSVLVRTKEPNARSSEQPRDARAK
jgi:hypothetical protein